MAVIVPERLKNILVAMGMVDVIDENGNVIETREREITDLETSIIIDGKEYPNPKPIEIPVGMKKPETFHDQLNRILNQREFVRELRKEKLPTIDEFLDMDEPEDSEFIDPLSKYQEASVQAEYVKVDSKPANTDGKQLINDSEREIQSNNRGLKNAEPGSTPINPSPTNPKKEE